MLTSPSSLSPTPRHFPWGATQTSLYHNAVGQQHEPPPSLGLRGSGAMAVEASPAERGRGGEEEEEGGEEKQEERVESVDVSCLTIFRCVRGGVRVRWMTSDLRPPNTDRWHLFHAYM